jgi:type I restriction enzyme M protein
VASTTAYEPTCGSGSLLLKVAAETGKHITLEGQEKDVTTAGLARMNMILHDFPTANILSGNTLAAPKFKDGEQLRTYDYVVANPPFSDKTWSTGLTPSADPFQRFPWGEPPAKQGDYAYLLHIIRSLKSGGKGACILPHGVLFRGNAEAVIRTQLVRSGFLKGIIGLPANLFYCTGIPACILVLDKENATARKGIFMIDARKGYIKDGNKNRLRERDLHQIVDVFTNAETHPGYSRLVPHAVCGTHMISRRPGLRPVVLKIGTLDDPSVYRGAQKAIFTAEGQPFHLIADGVPAFEGLPPLALVRLAVALGLLGHAMSL